MATTTKIIALCGLMRSGKDTIADYLSDHYGYVNIKIADSLKSSLACMFGFNRAQLEGASKDEIDARWGITPRAAMQFFGTEVMQYEIQRLLPHIGRTFWMSSLTAKMDDSVKYVISDMRFVHEYEYLVSKYDKSNVFVIRVTRPGLTLQQCSHQHISEQEFMKIPADAEVLNDDTIESLHQKIESIVNRR
jgi:dephospho-CoA kinase